MTSQGRDAQGKVCGRGVEPQVATLGRAAATEAPQPVLGLRKTQRQHSRGADSRQVTLPGSSSHPRVASLGQEAPSTSETNQATGQVQEEENQGLQELCQEWGRDHRCARRDVRAATRHLWLLRPPFWGESPAQC